MEPTHPAAPRPLVALLLLLLVAVPWYFPRVLTADNHYSDMSALADYPANTYEQRTLQRQVARGSYPPDSAMARAVHSHDWPRVRALIQQERAARSYSLSH